MAKGQGGDREIHESGDKAEKINRAVANIPKKMGTAFNRAPAGGGKLDGGKGGADMKGALDGHPSESNPLKGATRELRSPSRHEPLHGMHSKGSHGR